MKRRLEWKDLGKWNGSDESMVIARRRRKKKKKVESFACY